MAIHEPTEKLCNFLFIQQTFIQYISSGEHCGGYGGQAHRRLLPALKVIRRRHTCKETEQNGIDTVLVTEVFMHYSRTHVLKDDSVCFALSRLGNRKNATNPKSGGPCQV